MEQTTSSSGITLLGLGPGDASLLTRQAWDWLQTIPEVYLRTRQHPTVGGLPQHLRVISFDDIYDRSESFEQVYEEIVQRILELGRRPEGVTYAVPGHPFVAEATAPEIARRAKTLGLPVRIIEGVSFLEPVFSALELDPYPQLVMLDALELGCLHHPSFPPTLPLLVAQIYSTAVAADVKLTLNAVYPDQHRVKLIHAAGGSSQQVEELALFEIDRSPHLGLLSTLYVPPLAPDSSFEAFQEVIARLRAPDGCPWDREQNHLTLRKHLLEETYETLDAMDREDPADIAEEFGDLLLQIVLNAQIGAEAGEFSMLDVIQGIHRKIVRRHPHVFGELEVKDTADLLGKWEQWKTEERKNNGEEGKKGLLDGIPAALPALAQSYEIQDRVARVGFDWPEVQGVIEKVAEELKELQEAASPAEQSAELGDLLFVIVNLARWYKVDPETALREANLRFRQRYSRMEELLRRQNRTIQQLNFDEMNALWDQVKDELGQ